MTIQPDEQSVDVGVLPEGEADPGGAVVIEHRDGVEVKGVGRQDLLDALALLHAARQLQFELGTTAASGLLRAVSEARLELTPPAAVEQARRLAGRRRALLATPSYSHATLAEVRGDANVSATRTWVSRMRERGLLFTVRDNGRTVIPAFQLTQAGQPRAELAQTLQTLLGAGLDGWSLWVWLTSQTPLLSGRVPADLAVSDPARVHRAASRFVARREPAA